VDQGYRRVGSSNRQQVGGIKTREIRRAATCNDERTTVDRIVLKSAVSRAASRG
jgi:hypothetical protein